MMREFRERELEFDSKFDGNEMSRVGKGNGNGRGGNQKPILAVSADLYAKHVWAATCILSHDDGQHPATL